MTNHSYTWPARSRADMAAYLSEHASYCPMSPRSGGFCLSWNIKCNFTLDTSGTCEGSHDPALDDAWARHVEADNEGHMFWQACENALREYVDAEWSNYPGIEQGDWKFTTNGRSGGHLVLTEAPLWFSQPHGWRVNRMTWDCRAQFVEYLEQLDFKTLKRLYRAIRVLDRDLSREAIKENMAYQYAFLRECWEEEQREHNEARASKFAADVTASRPDMYGLT